MSSTLKEADDLQNQSSELALGAIERREDRPAFSRLFNDVRTFARGVGRASRVVSLAESLLQPDRSGALHEEAIWQEAAAEFLDRCRAQYSLDYADVVTGICEAVETCRMGLRLLSAAMETVDITDAEAVRGQITPDPVLRAQMFLLRFPYTTDDRTVAEKGEDALTSDLISSADGEAHASFSGMVHVALLQVSLRNYSGASFAPRKAVHDAARGPRKRVNVAITLTQAHAVRSLLVRGLS